MLTKPAAPELTTEVPRQGFKATASSAIGFALDFYDLYVIVFIAPVIASVFFPSAERTLSLAGAYVTLAATLIMRPVGAVLLGGVADRHGRKRSMVVALAGVGTVTALMGLLPTTHQIGVLAPILLLLLRLVQGLFVGGVFASTLTLATESVSPRRRGLASGLVGGGGTAAGSVLASLALFAALRVFPGPGFDDWGWRAMFLAGGLPIVLSFFVMRYVEESPVWKAPAAGARRPLRALLAPGRRRVLAVNVAVVFGIGTSFLLTLGFLPTYLQVVVGLPSDVVSTILIWVNLAAFVFAPLSGHLSERYGRRRVMFALSSINVFALPLLYLWLAGLRGDGPSPLVIGITLLASCLTVAAFGPLPIFLNERFATGVRASGTALSVNIGFALAGLVPTLVNATSGGTGRLPVFAAAGLFLAGAVTLACLSRTPEPGRGLD
ncbi:MFS transporter [Rhizohabitans arisaemae]|uniref:MFS transporter n=1 Tax=Rhizohabitans arisaemae TaxID=2720610 RepID=UPI0024B09779|nr:MFS transporter [Rhizohabitans arisaemae]